MARRRFSDLFKLLGIDEDDGEQQEPSVSDLEEQLAGIQPVDAQEILNANFPLPPAAARLPRQAGIFTVMPQFDRPSGMQTALSNVFSIAANAAVSRRRRQLQEELDALRKAQQAKRQANGRSSSGSII